MRVETRRWIRTLIGRPDCWPGSADPVARTGLLLAAAVTMIWTSDLLSIPPPPAARLIINEILAAPSDGLPEFVELLNSGSESVDLSDLRLEDARHVPGVIVSENAPPLLPGEFLVLTSDVAALVAHFGAVVRAVEVLPWPALNNGGDEVYVSIGDLPQDGLKYGGDWITPGLSIERINPHAPGISKSNWAASTASGGATPGQENSVFVYDTTGPQVLAVEFIADHLIEVTFSEPVDPSTLTESSLRLDGVPPVNLEFSDSKELLRITVQSDTQLIEFDAFSDFSGNMSGPFLREVARRPIPGDLFLSEILFDPGLTTESVERPEFIELTNRSDHAVSLSGVLLTVGNPDDPDHIVTLRPPGRVLAPEASAVVYAEPDPSFLPDPYIQSSLENTFPSFYHSPDVVLIPVSGRTLGLNNDHDTIVLRSEVSAALDDVTYSSAWHDERFQSHTGRSLVRLSGTDAGPLSWATYLGEEGTTPGFHALRPEGGYPPLPGDLLLTEIMFAPVADASDGRADQTEYLEFLNVSDKILNLNGLYLLSGPADRPLSDSLRLVYQPSLLQPGHVAVSFFLPEYVADGGQEAAGMLETGFPGTILGESSVLLPLRRSLGLSNNGERLQILAPSGGVLEEIEYDPSWHHFLVVDGDGSSIERIDRNGPTNNAENWTTSIAHSGGTPGSVSLPSNPNTAQAPVNRIIVVPKTFSPNFDGIEDIARITLNPESEYAAGRLSIFDMSGRVIRQFQERALSGANTTFNWLGDDDAGRRAPAGIYIILAEVSVATSGKVARYKTPIALVR